MQTQYDVAKTKFMIFGRQPYADTSVQIVKINVEKITQYKYLGCHITELDPDKDIKCRIETAYEN